MAFIAFQLFGVNPASGTVHIRIGSGIDTAFCTPYDSSLCSPMMLEL